MDIIWTKIIVALLFGVLRLVFGLLPIKLYSFLRIWEKGSDGMKHVNKERQKYADCVLTLVQSFGGGVLFATCFLHMMPEVYHAVHELENHYNLTREYPRSQLIICVGFFMIYFVEDISQYMIDKFSKCEKGTKHPDTISATKFHTNNINKVLPILNETNGPFEEKLFERINHFDTDSIDDEKNGFNKENTEKDTQSIDSGLSKSNEDINTKYSNNPLSTIPMPTDEKDLIIQLEKAPDRMLRCVLITMALSFHAIFEGIAIGLQSSVNNIWYIFVAISIHSVTLLFCVGVELLFSHKRTIVIFYFILVLSLTSPLGIMIGLAVTTQTSEKSMGTEIASALLEGLSAGTLLYITFFEVLTREKEKTELRLKRGCCIIMGFSVMAMLQILE